MKFAIKYTMNGKKTPKARIIDVGVNGNEEDAKREFRDWFNQEYEKGWYDIITIVLYGT